jgi:hypothetical protein
MSDKITPAARPIAEIEAQNRKQMEEVRKKEKEKEKAEEDQQYVIDGAILECKLCTNPVGMLKVNFDTPTIQNKKTATVKEKDSKSLIFMGTCTKSPNAAAPCVGVMQLGEWQDVGTSLVQDQKPLIKKSTIMCNYGGSTITIKKSGQINVPSVINLMGKQNVVIPDYVVLFRRLPEYKGEFGFDWMRDDYLTGTCIENLDDLKQIYTPFKVETKNIKTDLIYGEYYVPWLSMFPNHKEVSGKDVELLIETPSEFIKKGTNTKDEIMTFESSTPNLIITPNKMTIYDSNIIGKIKIECIGKITKNEVIKVKSSNGSLVGKLNVLKNDNVDKLKTEVTIIRVLRKDYKIADDKAIESAVDKEGLGKPTDELSKDLIILEDFLNKKSLNQGLIQCKLYRESGVIKVLNLEIDQDEYERKTYITTDKEGNKIFDSDKILDIVYNEFKKQFKDLESKRGLVVFLAPLNAKAGGVGDLHDPSAKKCMIFATNLSNLPSYSHELGHVMGLDHVFYKEGEKKNEELIRERNQYEIACQRNIKIYNDNIAIYKRNILSSQANITTNLTNLNDPKYATYFKENPSEKQKFLDVINEEKKNIEKSKKSIKEAEEGIKKTKRDKEDSEKKKQILLDNKFKFIKGKTDCIMDYSSNKNSFYKWQWEILQNDMLNYYNQK